MAPGWVGPGGGTGVTGVGGMVEGAGVGELVVMGVGFRLDSSGKSWTQYGVPMERRWQSVTVGFWDC